MAMKTSKASFSVLTIPAVVFMIIGLVFLLVGFGFVVSDIQFRGNGVETTATIIQLQPELIVEFTTRNGEIIQTGMDQRSSLMQVGDQIQIYYALENPYEVRSVEVTQVLTIVFCTIGVMFSWVGAGMFVALLVKRKQAALLRESGRRIYVRVEKTVVDRTIRVNRCHPYLLIGTGHLNGQEKEFRCRGFFDAPEMLIGKQMTVYYDPQNPKKYAVEAPEAL